MAYKAILVHLNNKPRVPRLVGAALQLALPANGHVTGLFIVPHPSISASASIAMIARATSRATAS